MSKEKKKYTVTIFGEQYTIISDDAPDHVMHVAALVDSSMQAIAQNSNLSDKKIAVLTALQFAGKLLSLESATKEEKIKYEALVSHIDQEVSSKLLS
ncbi:cell division protein ZapA [bacterium]|nr:cell division protein ZapA [bacterium]